MKWLYYEMASVVSKYTFGISTGITSVMYILSVFSLKEKHNLGAIQNTAVLSTVVF